MTEIVFLVEDEPEGGYTARALGESIFTQADDIATLRQNVTSPKGTTFAALEVLMAADGMQPLFDKAVAAAARRSRELAS